MKTTGDRHNEKSLWFRHGRLTSRDFIQKLIFGTDMYVIYGKNVV